MHKNGDANQITYDEQLKMEEQIIQQNKWLMADAEDRDHINENSLLEIENEVLGQRPKEATHNNAQK